MVLVGYVHTTYNTAEHAEFLLHASKTRGYITILQCLLIFHYLNRKCCVAELFFVNSTLRTNRIQKIIRCSFKTVTTSL